MIGTLSIGHVRVNAYAIIRDIIKILYTRDEF